MTAGMGHSFRRNMKDALGPLPSARYWLGIEAPAWAQVVAGSEEIVGGLLGEEGGAAGAIVFTTKGVIALGPEGEVSTQFSYRDMGRMGRLSKDSGAPCEVPVTLSDGRLVVLRVGPPIGVRFAVATYLLLAWDVWRGRS